MLSKLTHTLEWIEFETIRSCAQYSKENKTKTSRHWEIVVQVKDWDIDTLT